MLFISMIITLKRLWEAQKVAYDVLSHGFKTLQGLPASSTMTFVANEDLFSKVHIFLVTL